MELIKLFIVLLGFLLGDYISTKLPNGDTELQKTYYTMLKILIIVVVTSVFFIGTFLIFKK